MPRGQFISIKIFPRGGTARGGKGRPAPLPCDSSMSNVIKFGANRKPMYDFLLVINGNLGPISHRYWDTATYWPKSQIFPTSSHLGPSFKWLPSNLWKSFTVPKLSLPGSWWWKFGDPNLHRFWLIHPCDGQTERIVMANGGVYTIQQTSSKLPATIMLDVCWKFAGRLLPYVIMELDVCCIVWTPHKTR